MSRERRGIMFRMAAGVVVIGGAASGAWAQTAKTPLERIDRHERDAGALKRQSFQGVQLSSGAVSPPAVLATDSTEPLDGDIAAKLQTRLDDLERLIRRLTGRLEKTAFENRQLRDQLTRLTQDVEFRFQRLEAQGGAGAAAPVGPEQAESAGEPGAEPAAAADGKETDGAASLPEGTPEEQYRYAFDLLRKGRYRTAQAAFEAFVAAHPDHTLAGNAQYWLGETFYVRNDFEGAAVAFLKGYRTYPKSLKGPDNLLKLGLSMAALNNAKEACAAFGRLISDYPQAPPTIQRRAAAERKTLGCAGQ